MAPLTFTDALRIEVATLQAQHPILAEAIGRAHALLLDGKVFPCEDGTSAEVGSSTDPAVSYYVNGHCTCAASQFHPEPCKHRLAYRLYQRLADRLAAEEERWTVDLEPEVVAPPPAAHTEAPASVNVRLTVAGREVQWTLRDTDEARLAERLDALLARYPQEERSALIQTPDTPQCPKHGIPMRLNHGKDGSTWHSHKTADGWCKGR